MVSAELRSTNGLKVDVGLIKGKVVIDCYLISGRADIPFQMKFRLTKAL